MGGKDLGALVGLLDPDATGIADGGGLASAALGRIQGGEQIARLREIAGRAPDMTILERTVSGQPGLVAQQDGVTVMLVAIGVAGDRITPSGRSATPRNSGPGRRTDPRLHAIRSHPLVAAGLLRRER